MKNIRQVLLGFVLAGFMLVGGNAVAQTTLGIGETLDNSGGAINNTDPFTFPFLATTSNLFTSDSGTFSGMVNSYVQAGNTFNPYEGLTFGYFFHNDATSLDNIMRMTVDGFAGVRTAVAYTTSYSDTQFQRATRSGGTGNVVGAEYAILSGGGGIVPGDSCSGFCSSDSAASFGQIIVYTDATTYGAATARFIDGGIASAMVYAPVPEPEIYAMLAAGLGFMGFVARRRKQRLAA